MNTSVKVLSVVLALVFIPLLQQEAYAWCYWLAEKLIHYAVRLLPRPARERYEAEWLADLDTLKGRNLFTLLWAIKTLAYVPGVRQAVEGRPLRQLAAKRVLDVLIAGLALLLLLPLFAVIALAIRLTSPGPVVFRQQRTGMHGRQFTVLKFRTVGAGAALPPVRLDGTVTLVGRVLRRYSLDDLPLLWNVLRGEMSLVGPRALQSHEESQGDDSQTGQLEVRPGITNVRQISDLPYEPKLEKRLNQFYMENWSIAYDLYILIRAILSRAIRRKD